MRPLGCAASAGARRLEAAGRGSWHYDSFIASVYSLRYERIETNRLQLRLSCNGTALPSGLLVRKLVLCCFLDGRQLLLSWCRVAFASTADPVSCVCACVSPVAPLSLCGMSHSLCLLSSTAFVNRPKSAVASVAWSLWAPGRMERVRGCPHPHPSTPPPAFVASCGIRCR
jgi:hypothetical protein